MQKVAEKGNRNNGVFPAIMSWIFLISSFVLMLPPKWATEERGVSAAQCPHGSGKRSFSRRADLPSTAEMNACSHLPATVSNHVIWLSGGKGPRVSPPALPFSAQTPARHSHKGCSLPLLPEAQVSAGGSWAPSLSAPSHREKPKENGCSLLHWAPPWEKEIEAKDLDQDFRKTFFFPFSVSEIYNVFQKNAANTVIASRQASFRKVVAMRWNYPFNQKVWTQKRPVAVLREFTKLNKSYTTVGFVSLSSI